MAKDTSPQCKQCRREAVKLFLKGERCLTDKCAVERRMYPPGEHGRGRIKQSEYLLQLREKQKARRYYQVLEKQFHHYYEVASRKQGITGENLLCLLEMRLDNVVYRLGFAPSRKTARQMILHGHFLINGKACNIPSVLLSGGDVIQVTERSKKLDVIHNSMKRMKDSAMLPWLSLDKANLNGTFLQVPERADIPLPANEQLVVELYSK